MGAWDKRKIIFRVEGIGNRKVETYKDSHFTWTYIKFCTLMVTAGFWVRYLELFPSVFLFALDRSWKNLVRNIIGPFIRKNKLLVTQAAVYIRKIICTSEALHKARIAVVVGSRHSRPQSPRSFWQVAGIKTSLCKWKTSCDAILAQNFCITEVAACVISELFECIIYTMRQFCDSCKWELVHSAKWRWCIKRIHLRGMHELTLIVTIILVRYLFWNARCCG